jgi:hypothetical protein
MAKITKQVRIGLHPCLSAVGRNVGPGYILRIAFDAACPGVSSGVAAGPSGARCVVRTSARMAGRVIGGATGADDPTGNLPVGKTRAARCACDWRRRFGFWRRLNRFLRLNSSHLRWRRGGARR